MGTTLGYQSVPLNTREQGGSLHADRRDSALAPVLRGRVCADDVGRSGEERWRWQRQPLRWVRADCDAVRADLAMASGVREQDDDKARSATSWRLAGVDVDDHLSSSERGMQARRRRHHYSLAPAVLGLLAVPVARVGRCDRASSRCRRRDDHRPVWQGACRRAAGDRRDNGPAARDRRRLAPLCDGR